MSDWSWFAGEPKGRCPSCSEPLRRTDILVEWRKRVYHVECLLTLLAATAPAETFVYPATSWGAP